MRLLERKGIVSREELLQEIRVTITNSGEDGANPSLYKLAEWDFERLSDLNENVSPTLTSPHSNVLK